MTDVFADKPALRFVLTNESYDGRPFECSECPFAKALGFDEGFEPPNPSDPGEGHYDCHLTGIPAVWGENPKCEKANWQERARQELGVEA